jgi:hypothetical protein
MDKVKLYDDERLDIVDAQRLQSLVFDYLERAVGAMLGLQSGCLTHLPSVLAQVTPGDDLLHVYDPFNYDIEEQTVWLDPCLFYYVDPDPTGGRGRIIKFNPSADQQTEGTAANPISLKANINAQANFYIWAKGETTSGETDNRKFWIAADNLEKSQPTVVTETEVVSFAVGAGDSNTPPFAEDGWFKIARITSYSTDGVPSIQAMWCWDTRVNNSLTAEFQGEEYVYGPSSTSMVHTYGLVGILEELRKKVCRLHHSSYETQPGVTWVSQVPDGYGVAEILPQVTENTGRLDQIGDLPENTVSFLQKQLIRPIDFLSLTPMEQYSPIATANAHLKPGFHKDRAHAIPIYDSVTNVIHAQGPVHLCVGNESITVIDTEDPQDPTYGGKMIYFVPLPVRPGDELKTVSFSYYGLKNPFTETNDATMKNRWHVYLCMANTIAVQEGFDSVVLPTLDWYQGKKPFHQPGLVSMIGYGGDSGKQSIYDIEFDLTASAETTATGSLVMGSGGTSQMYLVFAIDAQVPGSQTADKMIHIQLFGGHVILDVPDGLKTTVI